MLKNGKATIVENVLVLAMMGILAGALGGLAIGLLTGRPAPSAAAAAH